MTSSLLLETLKPRMSSEEPTRSASNSIAVESDSDDEYHSATSASNWASTLYTVASVCYFLFGKFSNNQKAHRCYPVTIYACPISETELFYI